MDTNAVLQAFELFLFGAFFFGMVAFIVYVILEHQFNKRGLYELDEHGKRQNPKR